ncbi:hypothetical protein ACFGZA_05485 [Pasteurella multocida]
MKEFDLEKALTGEPILTRDHQKGYVKFTIEENSKIKKLVGIVHNGCLTEVEEWLPSGNVLSDDITPNDIIGMYEEPRPTVTLTLPSPITYPEENKRCYTIVINDVDAYDGDGSFVSISDWVAEKENGDYDYQTKQRIREGLLFATEEDAQAWLDALKNARR